MLIKLGEAYLLSENDNSATNDAFMYLSSAATLEPQNYNALIGLAKVHEKKNEVDLAIQYAEEAMKLNNTNLNAIYYLGMLQMKKKDMKKATDIFQKVLSIDYFKFYM